MIRIDSTWLATEPMDMRAALAKVIAVFGAATLCLSVHQPPRQSHESASA
ncbi:Transposase [Pseudomonas floridensis]